MKEKETEYSKKIANYSPSTLHLLIRSNNTELLKQGVYINGSQKHINIYSQEDLGTYREFEKTKSSGNSREFENRGRDTSKTSNS